MRRCRAALIVIALAALTLLVAGPAQAGGPTSVLLVVPGTGQTASLYYTDADYGTLARLVGAFGDPAGTGKTDASGRSHESGTQVNVTWLIHDVMVWRVDRIYLGVGGGPWIATQTDVSGSGNIWDSKVVWHTASDGARLAALVGKLGVRPSTSATGIDPAPGGAAGTIAPSSAPSTARAAAATHDANKPANASMPGWSGLVWGLGGLALGVAVTVIATRRGSTSRPNVGRQAAAGQPDTGDPDPPGVPHEVDDEVDDEPTWSAAEELTWPSHGR
jgi:hypothetical protein